MAKKKVTIEEKMANKQLNRVKEYQACFRSPVGNSVLKHLMKKHGFFKTTYVDDPYRTAFNEGQRAVVTEIMKTMKLNVNEIQEQIDKGEFNDE